MDAAWIGTISALGGALIASIVPLAKLLVDHQRESRQHADSLLLKGLEYLSGDEHKRNAGISILASILQDKPIYKVTIMNSLVSQATYLLLYTENTSSRCEKRNLLRIMELIRQYREDNPWQWDFYKEFQNALVIRGNHLESDRGVEIPFETLVIWAKEHDILDFAKRHGAYET